MCGCCGRAEEGARPILAVPRGLQEDRSWTLGITGNWATRIMDLDGDGNLNDAGDLNELNPLVTSAHFNNANEWIARDTNGDGTDDLTLVYDANGNLTDDDENYVYEYDAWNRLISISTTGGSPALVAEYRYNGLGQRIAESDGTDTEHLMYDDRWRLISRHDGTDYLEETLHHHAGLDGFGGASDVDSVIMRRTYLTTGSPQTEDERWYVLQNWRQDAVAVINEAAVQRESRIRLPARFSLP